LDPYPAPCRPGDDTDTGGQTFKNVHDDLFLLPHGNRPADKKVKNLHGNDLHAISPDLKGTMHLLSQGFPLSGTGSNAPGDTRIFIVEDNPGVCEAIVVSLLDIGYLVAGYSSSAEEALSDIPLLSPDLIIMDINLAGEMDGVEAATRIHKELFIPVVFLTGNADEALTPRIAASGSYGYLVKPYNERELNLTIEIALYKHRMEVQIRQSIQFYHALAEAFEHGIVLIDHMREIRYINRDASRILRLIMGEGVMDLIGQPVHLLPPGAFRDHVLQIIGSVSASGKQMNKVIPFTLDENEYWFDLHAIPASDNTALRHGIILVIHDVTVQVELEMETRKAGLNRIEENMEKFQVLNDQIRNPLQVLTGLIDMDDSPYKGRYFEQIKIIDQVIRDFDEAWIRSEKVRKFLLTHFGHGIFLRK
jgi:PAS domain S-box-containing protein